jgi:SAM-dependent methyltransferase/TusA-related sulfurtransferase
MTDLMHKAEIQQLVRAAYVAVDVPRGSGSVYYSAEQLASLPPEAVAWSFGVGNPLEHAQLAPGARVLDVGCGGGIDVLLAARRVGPDGHVTGLDLLPEMCARARANATEAGLSNVEIASIDIIEGEMEAIPLPDDAVDAIISNGVINLSARKMRALFECARVLRPGGHLCLTDVTIDERDLPPEVLLHPAAWSGCAAGAMAERALLRALARVGLVDVEVRERHAFGVEDCARFPLFTPDLLEVMRATIPQERQSVIATVVTVTARQPDKDAQERGVVASPEVRNPPVSRPVLEGMENTIREFSAGDRACGDGVGRDLRAWWASVPPGTRTVVTMRDPSTKADVPPLARMLGHTVEDMTENGDTLRVTVRTKGDRT